MKDLALTPNNANYKLLSYYYYYILISFVDSTVGFSNETVVFYETDSFVMVPLHRHGDLNFETKVFCEITPITATKDSDFLMPLKPETVKFRVNQTTGGKGVCLQKKTKLIWKLHGLFFFFFVVVVN